MTQKAFATQLLLQPECVSLVPWDAELLGVGKFAKQPVLFWKSEEGVSERTAKVEASFYLAVIGDPLPDDLGEFVGAVEFQVEIAKLGPDGKMGSGIEEVDVLVFRKAAPQKAN